MQGACHPGFALCLRPMGQLSKRPAGEIKLKFHFLQYNNHHCLKTLRIRHLMNTGDQFSTHGGHRGIQIGYSDSLSAQPCFPQPASLNHVFLNPVSLEHVCFINCSLSLLPSACFPQPSCMHFPITSPSAPHNQRISSLY
jgi:hypothetical protein